MSYKGGRGGGRYQPAQRYPQHRHAQRQPRHQPAPRRPPAVVQVVDLPFDQVHRRPADLLMRRPGRPVSDSLKSATAHWAAADLSRNLALESHVPVVCSTTESLPYVEPQHPSEPACDHRVLLLSGVRSRRRGREHISRCIELVAAQPRRECGAAGALQGYGGPVSGDTDDERLESLALLVRQQCGLSLDPAQLDKLVEFTYSDGRSTTFFLPRELPSDATLGHPRVLVQSQVQQAGSEEGEPRQRVRLRPVRVPIGAVLEDSVHAELPLPTVEFAMAVDALDECIRQRMATRIREFLTQQKAVTERADSRKRMRDDVHESCKRQRGADEKVLRDQWGAEDQGRTDDEKKALLENRQAEMEEVRVKWAAWLRGELQRLPPEDAPVTDDDGDPCNEVQRLDTSAYNAFQYFAAPAAGGRSAMSVPADRLERALLCLSGDQSLRTVRALLPRCGADSRVLYGRVSKATVLEKIPKQERAVTEEAPEAAVEAATGGAEDAAIDEAQEAAMDDIADIPPPAFDEVAGDQDFAFEQFVAGAGMDDEDYFTGALAAADV